MDPATLLKKSARLYGNNTAYVCGERRQTYAELLERSARLANALRARGIQQGDRVALLGPNSAETMEHIGGLALGGFVRCPLYAHDTPDKHQYLLELTGATAIIVHRSHLEALEPVLPEVPGLKVVLVIGGDHDERDYELAMQDADPHPPAVTLSDDDPHVIRFSAGTTGKPKGILHTVRGFMDMGNEMALVVSRLAEHDRYLAPAPLTHAAGLFVWPMVAVGAATVVMPAFDTTGFLDLVERERATVALAVPTMIQMITESPGVRERDLSSLHTVIYGTAPISVATLTAAINLWGNIMYNIYGQSEALPLTILAPQHHVLDGDERQRSWLRSVGRPTPNSEVVIMDDDGNELPAGEVGEIVGRSPGAMRELWGAPEATAERMSPDGWVRTRDVGWMSEDGFLYLTDRKEDTIISGGYNIWPKELEDALQQHPAVAEAAVVGVPHPKWGETPHAEVALRDGHDVTAEELIAWTKDQVGSVKKVTSIDFVDAVPRTPIGKLARREVRQHWAQRQGRTAST